MGNQLGIGQTASSLHDLPSLLAELMPSLQFRRNLGSGKVKNVLRLNDAACFNHVQVLKTVECSCAQGIVVIKIYLRRDQSLTLLTSYTNQLETTSSQLISSPCLLPYVSWHISPRAAFLVRPYVASNLHDRFHTRPFLTQTEKVSDFLSCVI